MHFHRNSQKRIYEPDKAYFITTNTFNRHSYFDEDIFCRLFIEELEYCRRLKKFEVIAYKINPEHIHLLIRPGFEYNFSEIMGSLKRNFTRDYNDLINGNGFIRSNERDKLNKGHLHKGDDSNRRLYGDGLNMNDNIFNNNDFLEHVEILKHLQSEFTSKHGIKHAFPVFKWQKSFHYHIIEDNMDLINHIHYIENQCIKHKLSENKYLYVKME